MQVRKDFKSIIFKLKNHSWLSKSRKKLYLATYLSAGKHAKFFEKIIFEMQFLHRKCSDANAFHLFSKGRCFLKDRGTKCLIEMPNYHKKSMKY